MYLVEVAPQRWTVRLKKPKGEDLTWIEGYRRGARDKFLGTIEFHEFWTYKDGERVKSGFWIARPPDHGWKESGWKKYDTKKEALASLTGRVLKKRKLAV
jgi:hypothetical protein